MTKATFVNAKGLTLVEACVGMMIMAVLTIAIGSMVRGGMEAQMNDRLYGNMQIVATNIADDLRFDFQRAGRVQVDSGTQITIFYDSTSATPDAIYQLTAGNFTGQVRRNGAMVTKVYNQVSATQAYTPALSVSCVTAAGAATNCFTGQNFDANINAFRRIQLSDIAVQAAGLNNNGVFRNFQLQNFGPPTFRVAGMNYSIAGANSFR